MLYNKYYKNILENKNSLVSAIKGQIIHLLAFSNSKYYYNVFQYPIL